MSKTLIGCSESCAVSVGEDSLVVMGGVGDGNKWLNDVQVFDGKTWHLGPPLPHECRRISGMVHGNLVFAMGGGDMARAVWCANINDLVSH